MDKETVHKAIDWAYFKLLDHNTFVLNGSYPEGVVDFSEKVPPLDLINGNKEYYLNHPEKVFPDFPERKLNIRRSRHPKLETERIPCRHYIYDSPLPSDYPEVSIGSLRHFTRLVGRNDRGVLYVPGWSGKDLGDEIRFSAELRNRGVDVWLMTIPYQTERTPEGYESGELYINEWQEVTASSVSRSVIEQRKLIQELKEHYEKFGIFAHSAGGFSASLTDLCEPTDFKFSCFTTSQVTDAVYESDYTKAMRRRFKMRGYSMEQVKSMWELGDAQVYEVDGKSDNYFHIIAERDLAIPTRLQRNWREYNGDPPTFNLDSGHSEFKFHFKEIAEWTAKQIHCID